MRFKLECKFFLLFSELVFSGFHFDPKPGILTLRDRKVYIPYSGLQTLILQPFPGTRRSAGGVRYGVHSLKRVSMLHGSPSEKCHLVIMFGVIHTFEYSFTLAICPSRFVTLTILLSMDIPSFFSSNTRAGSLAHWNIFKASPPVIDSPASRYILIFWRCVKRSMVILFKNRRGVPGLTAAPRFHRLPQRGRIILLPVPRLPGPWQSPLWLSGLDL